MRIGILTLPFNNNYGGYLQSYALMTILKDLGHNVILLNRRHNLRKRTLKEQIIYAIKGIIKSLIYCKRIPLKYDPEWLYKQEGEYMLKFVEKKIIPMTKPIYDRKELEHIVEDGFDAIIVGSDQVWRPIYVPNIEDYFLKFISSTSLKRISYAASFGTEKPEFTLEQIEECGKLLSFFDSVSFREKDGLKIIDDFGWVCKKKEVVLDPTMLLNKEHYFSLLENEANPLYDNSFFCYILDVNETSLSIVDKCSYNLSLKPYYIISLYKKGLYKFPPIEMWLKGIKESPFVVTDSFHGTVFCLLFNVPFIVYANKTRGVSRFISLLEKFNLEERIVYASSEVTNVLNKEIDWDLVNRKITEEKIHSINYLKNSLI